VTKPKEPKREKEERATQVTNFQPLSTSASFPFYREGGREEVLFMIIGVVCIYRNTLRVINRPPTVSLCL
jgi:hypothetical protein